MTDTITTTDVAPALDAPRHDATAPPEAPRAPRRRGPNWKAWRARLVVVLMITAAAVGAARLVQARNADLAKYDLGTVTLTAHAIPVEPRQPGQVSEVDVHALEHVTAGQKLGTIVTTTTLATGALLQTSHPLTAPSAGVVSGDPAPVGSAVQPGAPFAQLYDPATLTLDAAIKVQDLPRLAPGMTATLHAKGVDRPVVATVQRVVPLVETGTDAGSVPNDQNRLELVLVPRSAADVAELVPGLHFTGEVDTLTAPAGSPRLVNVGH